MKVFAAVIAAFAIVPVFAGQHGLKFEYCDADAVEVWTQGFKDARVLVENIKDNFWKLPEVQKPTEGENFKHPDVQLYMQYFGVAGLADKAFIHVSHVYDVLLEYMDKKAPVVQCFHRDGIKYHETNARNACKKRPVWPENAMALGFFGVFKDRLHICEEAKDRDASLSELLESFGGDNTTTGNFFRAHETLSAVSVIVGLTGFHIDLFPGWLTGNIEVNEFDLEQISHGPTNNEFHLCQGVKCAQWLGSHSTQAALANSDNYAHFALDYYLRGHNLSPPIFERDIEEWPEACEQSGTIGQLSRCLGRNTK